MLSSWRWAGAEQRLRGFERRRATIGAPLSSCLLPSLAVPRASMHCWTDAACVTRHQETVGGACGWRDDRSHRHRNARLQGSTKHMQTCGGRRDGRGLGTRLGASSVALAGRQAGELAGELAGRQAGRQAGKLAGELAHRRRLQWRRLGPSPACVAQASRGSGGTDRPATAALLRLPSSWPHPRPVSGPQAGGRVGAGSGAALPPKGSAACGLGRPARRRSGAPA